MKKVILVAGLLLALTACAAPKEAAETLAATPGIIPSPVASLPPAPERTDHVDHTLTVGEEEYTVRMVGVPGRYVLDENAMVLTRVEVYRREDISVPFQVLEEYDPDVIDTLPMNGQFLIQDVNFDGWTDFCYETLDYRGNLDMAQVLWEPENGQFGYAESGVCNPTYDAGTELVYEMRGGGLWGFAQTVSRWEGKSLAPVCKFDVHGDEEASNEWYLAEAGELKQGRGWTGEIAPDGNRLLPEAEPYCALSRPLEEIEDPMDGTYVVWRLVNIGTGRPVYAAKLTSEYTNDGPGAEHNCLRKIEFYRLGDLEIPFQTIPLEDGDGRMFPPGTDFNFRLEDLDFDGWPDLRFFKYLGTVNTSDYCILYDPATGTFARNETLEYIFSLEIDREKEVLKGGERDGYGIYCDYFYRWIDGEAKMVRQVRSEPSPGGTGMDYQVWDFVDGELQEVQYYANPEKNGGAEALAELDRWRTDPDYHGEDVRT